MNLPALRGLLIVCAAALGQGLLGCTSTSQTAFTPKRPIALFGEVHDNAAQHALRRQAFETLLRDGARPALLLEQFDRERQPAIDRARASVSAPNAAQIILAGSGAPASETRLWNWPFYEPLIALALAYELPIVAANVSREDARRVISDGLGPHGFDSGVAPEIQRAQAESIEASHCGVLAAPQAQRMASAQIARDQFMARMVEVHAARGVFLLAGNGHVRSDIGVPRWLTPATRRLTESIGMLEADDPKRPDHEGAFDRVIVTPRQVRPDPCARLR